MAELFNVVPHRFFNPLAAVTNGQNGQVYASCLLAFNQIFTSETQVPREDLRNAVLDVLAAGNVSSMDDPELRPETADEVKKENTSAKMTSEDALLQKRTELANRILLYLADEEVGWIEEGVDSGTFRRTYMMTEQAMLLADYVERASAQKFDEMSNYLYNSYLVIADFTKHTKERTGNHPYTSVILNIYDNMVRMNGQLKLLRRAIQRIIRAVTGNLSFDELMDHLAEYLDGEFIGEFMRLINNENGSLFSGPILTMLHRLIGNEKTRMIFVEDCMAVHKEENMTRQQALDLVLDQTGFIENFLNEGYGGIVRDIRNQMVDYIMITRLKLKMGMDLSEGSQDMIAHYLQILSLLDSNAKVPEDMARAFRLLDAHFVSPRSVRGARILHEKMKASPEDTVMLSQDDLEEARAELKNQAESLHTRQKMKAYMDYYRKNHVVRASDLPLFTKDDITNNLAAASFADANRMDVKVDDEYLRSGSLQMRDFSLTDREEHFTQGSEEPDGGEKNNE